MCAYLTLRSAIRCAWSMILMANTGVEFVRREEYDMMDEADGEEPSMLDGGERFDGEDEERLLVACTTWFTSESIYLRVSSTLTVL
jgi:hypothetical protein